MVWNEQNVDIQEDKYKQHQSNRKKLSSKILPIPAIDETHNVDSRTQENRQKTNSVDSIPLTNTQIYRNDSTNQKWLANYLKSKRKKRTVFIVRFVCLYVHTMQQRLTKGGSRHI